MYAYLQLQQNVSIYANHTLFIWDLTQLGNYTCFSCFEILKELSYLRSKAELM